MVLRPLPLTRTDRLPAELMAQVLDNTKDDTQTLHTCCLVCAAWHSYLIDSLYEPIYLKSRSQLYRLASAARIYPAVRERLALVRSVILDERAVRAPRIANVFPLVLGPHLYSVQDLTIRNCFRHPLHPSLFIMLPQLKDVKRLDLSGSPPQSFVDFQRIVRAFPQLEELDIATLTKSSWNASQLTPPHILNLPCVSKLTCVHVSDRVPEFFRSLVVWLCSGSVCSTIRSLHISLHRSSIRETWPLNTLLAHTASTLEHLCMHILVGRWVDHLGFPQFLHLRVLDMTLETWRNPMSTEKIQRVFHNILASLTSPALERVSLVLRGSFATALSTQGTYSRDATTDAYRAQYADLHAVLARPIFPFLRCVMVVLRSDQPGSWIPGKDEALKHLDFLRALFAPSCMRGIANLACAISTTNESWEVAVDKGEGPRYIDLRRWNYDSKTALQVVGFDP